MARIILAWLFASTFAIFPVSGAYGFALQPEWSVEFARSFLHHWILPFSALFLVAFGGWAIGMRNLIIYELEADYSNYLASLGAPTSSSASTRIATPSSRRSPDWRWRSARSLQAPSSRSCSPIRVSGR